MAGFYPEPAFTELRRSVEGLTQYNPVVTSKLKQRKNLYIFAEQSYSIEILNNTHRFQCS